MSRRDAILAELTVTQFLEQSGFESERSGNSRRYSVCPTCGPTTKSGTGKFWARADFGNCNACQFSGDLYAIAGAVLGIDPGTEFPRLLDKLANMAGISEDYDPAEAQRKIEHRRLLRQIEEDRARLTRERAESGVPETWRELPSTNRKGQEYLAGRGIMPNQAGREVRYTSRSACLALNRDGGIVNIVGRRFDGCTTPKIRGLDGCGTRGTFGRPVRNSMHAGPIVVVEGFFDYLSARELSPTRLVLGAHGCGNLPYVATVAAKIIAETPTGLVLVPHRDKAGEQAMERARQAAIDAGVSPAAIQIFELAEGCNDLNDHLCAGGRRAA